jgi:hypothetical protein
MSEERTVKKVFKNTLEGKSSVGKPRKRWLCDVKNDLKKMGVRGWRKIAKGRDDWKLILKEARALHGPHSQWRKRVLTSKHNIVICLLPHSSGYNCY